MKLFFSANSWMYRLLGRVVDLFILNILFLVTSLPIVTLGVSLSALYTVALKIVQDEDASIFGDYFKAFKSNFKRGMGLSCLLLPLSFLLVYSFKIVPELSGFSFIVGLFGSILFLFLLAMEVMYVFPYTARYDDSFVNSVKVSIQIALLNLKNTFFMFAILLAVVLLATFGNAAFALIGLLMLSIGFSTLATLISFLTLPIFQKYEGQVSRV